MARKAEYQDVSPRESRKEMFSRVVKKARSYLTKEGYEKPNPQPMEPPIGYKRQPSIMEQVNQQVRAELARRLAVEQGAESPEEADDFDVEGDPFPVSPHEQDIDPPVDPRAQPADPLTSAIRDGMLAAEQELNRMAERQPASPPSGGNQPLPNTPEDRGGGERGSHPERPPEPPPAPRGRSFLRRG